VLTAAEYKPLHPTREPEFVYREGQPNLASRNSQQRRGHHWHHCAPTLTGIGAPILFFINIGDINALVIPDSQYRNPGPRDFQYNGDGLRTKQETGRFITSYVWDVGAGLPVVLQEITDNDLHMDFVEPPKGYFESTYVYGLDLISATDEDGVQTYYFSDGLGSTTTVADAGGGVVSEYGYDVFGELRGQSGVPDDTMLFAGEQYDAKARHDAGDPGLYYLRARYYDPTIGRFMSQDPVPSQNLYAYAGNNPVRYVDPLGLLANEGGNFANVNLEDVCWYEYPFCVHVIMDGYHQLCAMNDRAEPIACQKLRPAGTPLAKRAWDKFWDAGEYYNAWITHQGEKVNALHAGYHEWLDDPCTQAEINLAATLLSTAGQSGFAASVEAPVWLGGASSVHGGVTLLEATQEYKRACGG